MSEWETIILPVCTFVLFFSMFLLACYCARKHQRKIQLQQPAAVVIHPPPFVISASNPSNDVPHCTRCLGSAPAPSVRPESSTDVVGTSEVISSHFSQHLVLRLFFYYCAIQSNLISDLNVLFDQGLPSYEEAQSFPTFPPRSKKTSNMRPEEAAGVHVLSRITFKLVEHVYIPSYTNLYFPIQSEMSKVAQVLLLRNVNQTLNKALFILKL